MKTWSAFVAIFLLGITTAVAGTGKQSFNLPGALPSGSSVWLSEFVEAVGSGAAIASTFRVPPSNPANFYAGITHVNADGTLNTSMAPGGVFIHSTKTTMYAFDSMLDKLAIAGLWQAVSGNSYVQTFSAVDPSFDPPSVNLAGTGTYSAAAHDEANSRFIFLEKNNPYISVVVTDEDGLIDTSFNGTGILDTGLHTGIYPNAVQVGALSDGSIIVAVSQTNYWVGNTLHLRRYSATGTLLASASPSIGFISPTDLAVDSQDRIVIVGTIGVTVPTSGQQAIVLRYTSGLAADSNFGTSGRATFTFLASPGQTLCPLGGCFLNGVGIQADDKIVVGGFRNAKASLAVARVNTNGTLDSTFGSSGVQYITISGSTLFDNGAIDLDEGDAIWITGGAYQSGMTNRKTLLALLTPDGALDTSFGSTP